MQTKKDYSIGVVPLYINSDDIIYVCLVRHQATYSPAGHWAFPKGHKDNNESDKETALRELSEETGIRDVELEDRTFEEHYSFEAEGIKYDKTVKYFVGLTKDRSYAIPDEFKNEISKVAWLPYEDALERCTYQETKNTLKSAMDYVKNRQ